MKRFIREEKVRLYLFLKRETPLVQRKVRLVPLYYRLRVRSLPQQEVLGDEACVVEPA